jgi:hypothetical protein
VTRQLEGDIAALREELGTLVGELDHRRHELLDVKLQLKRHAGGAALFGVALVATAGGVIWWGTWRARRRGNILSRAGQLGEAVARMVDRPERVAAEQTVPGKIVTAAVTAAVATLVKKGLERIVRSVLDRSRDDTRARPALFGRAPQPSPSRVPDTYDDRSAEALRTHPAEPSHGHATAA